MSRRKTKKKAQTPSSTAAAHEAAASPPSPGLNTGEDAAPEAHSFAPIENDSTQSRLVTSDPASTSPSVPPSVSSSDDTNLSTPVQPVTATDGAPSSVDPQPNLRPLNFDEESEDSLGDESKESEERNADSPLPGIPPPQLSPEICEIISRWNAEHPESSNQSDKFVSRHFCPSLFVVLS